MISKQFKIIALLLINALTASGQHFVGFKNSYAFNDIASMPSIGSKLITTAFNPAIAYNYTHRSFAALQAELALVSKGYEIEADTARKTNPVRHHITSIELPLATQLFLKFGVFRPYFTGGVTVGYITKRSIDSLGVTRKYVFDQYDRRFEYGLTIGLGTGIKIDRFELQIEGRYLYNFSFLRQPVITGRSNQYLNSTRLAISMCVLYRFAQAR